MWYLDSFEDINYILRLSSCMQFFRVLSCPLVLDRLGLFGVALWNLGQEVLEADHTNTTKHLVVWSLPGRAELRELGHVRVHSPITKVSSSQEECQSFYVDKR